MWEERTVCTQVVCKCSVEAIRVYTYIFCVWFNKEVCEDVQCFSVSECTSVYISDHLVEHLSQEFCLHSYMY